MGQAKQKQLMVSSQLEATLDIHHIVLIHLSPALCDSTMMEEIELFRTEIP